MQILQNKVTTLEIKVETLENRVRYLESGLEVSNYINDALSKELDKHKLQKQYFRRNCLIISSIPVKKNETINDIKMAAEKVATDIIGAKNDDYDLEFDKAHLVENGRK